MIDFTCYLLEDTMRHGEFMAPTEPGVPGLKTFRTAKDAEAYLWSRDCLVTMGYRIVEQSVHDTWEIQE